MGTHAALARTTWVGGYDFTTDTNQTSLALSRGPLDVTVFRTDLVGRSRIAGLQDVQSSVAGFWQSDVGQVDPTVFAALGGTVQACSQTVSGAEGDVAYFYQARKFEYNMFGQLGEPCPFTLNLQSAKGSGSLSVGGVRGRLLKAKGDVSATGAIGTGIQLGATSSTQFLYAAFHVFAVGTTITVVLESDDSNTFATATTRMTFGPITTTGGTWGTRVAGPITDDWYRLRVTAVTGTFSVAGVAGIK